ncbi:acyl-homoserine-lactone synthase [Caenimonas sedimenti]|uniref:Acyl-homoserine-lactone synthase n=1 Tax=Caenimonas sedimenti TaxID=2596921 RepID=A0A562ZY06_9BURK|nr:acyl-homoserine-lactone synthase [Caenimonas sedimenti]TWO73218.1 acyl-homoserine-lactone synthase [Caenimonas sedimenti]
MHTVVTGSLEQLSEIERDGMFRLRYEVFHERLGWQVHTTPDGKEIDQYDALPDASYIVARTPDHRVDACWRILPTLGPNMLRDVFPELLHGQPAPASADCWELSRFALATARLASTEDAGNPQLGFGELSVALMTEASRLAQAHGVARYVTVTTAPIERMLKKQGVNVHRLGPPVRIGGVLTVACFIEADEITRRALGQ